MSNRFATLAEGVRYGWRINYALKVEGIPFIFVEDDSNGSDPSGYQQDASLVIDNSAAIGSIIDREAGIGRGFDLSVTLLRTTATEAMFTQPTKATALASTLDYDETTSMSLDDVTGWTTSDQVYIGRELITFTSIDSGNDEFDSLSRGSPNGEWPAYEFDATSAISTWVTNSPLLWRGRQVKLYAYPVDPFGNTPGANILTESSLIWRGKITSTPRPNRFGWSFACSSLERELEKPTGNSVTATGKLDPFGDQIVTVSQPQVVWRFEHFEASTGTYEPVGGASHTTLLEFTPLSGYSSGDTLLLSEWRAAVKSAYDTAVTALGVNEYGDAWWEKKVDAAGPGVITWNFVVQLQRDAGTTGSEYRVGVSGGAGLSEIPFGIASDTKIPGSLIPDATNGAYLDYQIPLIAFTPASTLALTVQSDTGDVDDLPSSGWLRFERDGVARMFRYDSLEKTSAGSEARPVLSDGETMEYLFTSNESGTGHDEWFSVEFLGRIQGSYPDAMRKILMSSGRGDNDGTYDTLASAYGYDLDAVDTDSFDTNLSTWSSLTGDIAVEGSSSFTDIFGGVCELGRVAVVPRMASDGSDVTLTAVRTAFASSAASAATIADDDLVTNGGRPAVRHVKRKDAPNGWRVTFQVGDDEQTLTVRDNVMQAAEGVNNRDITLRGLTKGDHIDQVATWAQGAFSDRYGVEAYEIDVAPWVDVDVADRVDLALTHYNLWTKRTGAIGYTGQALVIGRRLPPATGVQTLTVLIGGMYEQKTLSPSMLVTAFGGTGAAPTSLTVPGKYYDLCVAYLASSNPFTLVAYKPGKDVAGTQTHTVTAVSGSISTTTTLTVGTTSGGHTLVANEWYLTLPATASANDAQNKHAHVDDGSRMI